jgi:uncharacterized protein YbjT (DUF2867 family)
VRLLVTGGSGVLGRALLAALTVPSGSYNVCRDGERVSNQLFAEASGWHLRH